MRVILTADWHIKLTSKDIPKDWQKNRYMAVVDNINKLKSDAIIIMGDFFDKIPSIEELDFGLQVLHYFSSPVYIFDGNHEATKKGETFLSKPFFNLFNNIKVITTNNQLFDTFQILPYNQLKNIESINKTHDTLLTHVRGEIPPHVKPEISLDLLSRWSNVFAGDLHFPHTQKNVIYPGTPLSTEFKRHEFKGSVIIYDTESNTYSTSYLLNIPQLYLKTVHDKKDIIEDNFDHVMYEVKGDIGKVKSIQHSLIKNKKVSSNTEALLSFSSEMDISEEVNLYMETVLNLEKDTINKAMDIFFMEVEPKYDSNL